ncbi:MAG: hypothetical protein ACPGVB_00100 [Chitinophagales bacterium]
MQHFNQTNIHSLSFPDTFNGQYAKRLLLPLIKKGTLQFFDNVDCKIELLVVNNEFIPISITQAKAKIKNSYVCSPITHYVDYGFREIDIEFPNRPLLKGFCKSVLWSFKTAFIRSSFDQVVMVNNWLLSTNLYPNLTTSDIEEINRFLIKRFPEHAIIYRSVNPLLNGELLETLSKAGFERILSRQVYLIDPKKGIYKKKKAYKIDLSLERKTTDLQWFDASHISPEDLPRLKALYDDLYLQKYAEYNPQLTLSFFEHVLKEKWLNMWVLKDKQTSQIEAVIGYFNRNGVMTTPVIGYNRQIPQKKGLYRLITLQIIKQAVENGYLLHMSSGASQFKKIRGGEPYLEYNMVYYKHLPMSQRVPWSAFEGLTKYLAVPIFERFEL